MKFNFLASLCSLGDWFESRFVGNPKDRIVWLFLAMPRVCLQFVIVVVSDHTHLLFLSRRGPFHNNELAPMPRIHVVSPYCMVASLIKKTRGTF